MDSPFRSPQRCSRRPARLPQSSGLLRRHNHRAGDKPSTPDAMPGIAGQIHLTTAIGTFDIWCVDLTDNFVPTGGTYRVRTSADLLSEPASRPCHPPKLARWAPWRCTGISSSLTPVFTALNRSPQRSRSRSGTSNTEPFHLRGTWFADQLRAAAPEPRRAIHIQCRHGQSLGRVL